LNNTPTVAETLSVSQLNRQVKRLLESHFGFVWVEGEISNFSRPSSGHWYFSLKDDSGQVRCAMFRNTNQRVRIAPESGLQVRIRARVSLYEGRGEYQLIVEHMEAAGAGAMQLAFEQLKQKLNAEGLFDPAGKQDLPAFPAEIGIITSPTGAAIRDIVSVFRRRFPAITLSVLPVPVQGADSAPAVVAALQQANRWQQSGHCAFDALILARGGGSIEDLWSFNDEAVARAIADSDIPVVSAVGHEIDFTIADFAADVRAPTPSAAAEMLSPDARELWHQYRGLEVSLQRSQRSLLELARHKLAGLARNLRHPGERLREQVQRLDGLDIRLRNSVRQQINASGYRLQVHSAQLSRYAPGPRLQQLGSRLVTLQQRASQAVQAALQQQGQKLERAKALLDSLGPQATLARGYAIVTNEYGKLVTVADSVAAGDRINTRLAQGTISSTVNADD